MPEEAELAVRGQDTVDLTERGLLAGDGAQDEGGDSGVEGGIADREVLGDAIRRLLPRRRARPANVGSAWLRAQPTVTGPIIGLRTIEQLEGQWGRSTLITGGTGRPDCSRHHQTRWMRAPGSGLSLSWHYLRMRTCRPHFWPHSLFGFFRF